MVIRHSVDDKQHNCGVCGESDVLERLLSTINLHKTSAPQKEAAGSLVKEHIESTREEIKDMKEKLKHNWVQDE